MGKYDAQKETARRMIESYGTEGILHHIEVISDPSAPYKLATGSTEVTTPLKFVSFANDGVTFTDHTLVGNSRVFLALALDPQDSDIAKGDRISYRNNTKTVTVLDFKRLNPDEDAEGDILWSILVT